MSDLFRNLTDEELRKALVITLLCFAGARAVLLSDPAWREWVQAITVAHAESAEVFLRFAQVYQQPDIARLHDCILAETALHDA